MESIIDLLKVGDNITYDGVLYSILYINYKNKTIRVKPHNGSLEDRIFIESMLKDLDEPFLLDRKLELIEKYK